MFDLSGLFTATRYGFHGAVCGQNFSDHNAEVVCRQRGFARGYSLRAEPTPVHSLPYVLSGLRCRGNETGIDQCQRAPFVTASTDCSVGTSPHVLCTKTQGGWI